MEEEAPNQNTKKNPSQRKPDGLKPKAIKWKKNWHAMINEMRSA